MSRFICRLHRGLDRRGEDIFPAGLENAAVRPVRDRLDADEAPPRILVEIRNPAFGAGVPHDEAVVPGRRNRDGAAKSRINHGEFVARRRRQCEDVIGGMVHHEIASLLVVLACDAVEEREPVQALHRRAVALTEKNVWVEPAAKAELFLAGVCRSHRQVELHGDGHLDLEAEIVRPGGARGFVGPEDKRHLGHLVGIFARGDLERHRAGEAMLRQLLRETVAELRKADGDTAVERLAAVVVALRGTEDHLRMARRAIGKDVCAEKRDFRRAILVCEDDVRVAAVPRAEHYPPRRAIAGIELVDVHDVEIIPKFYAEQLRSSGQPCRTCRSCRSKEPQADESYTVDLLQKSPTLFR